MTDFDKVRNYYRHFDEDNRLKWDASGRLEYDMTLRILEKHLPETGKVLDLGGAAGTYSFWMAERGYEVTLADLSEELIAKAKEKDTAHILKNCDVVNATDLSRYPGEYFDAVVAFGPFYHLTDAAERRSAAAEMTRVLKPDGKVLAAFIPFLSGSIAIVDRYGWSPAQVNGENLKEVFLSGKFVNLAEFGFQEGYYAESTEMEALFSSCGLVTETIRSVRGFGYGREEMLDSIEDAHMKEMIYELMEKTATRKEIVETCGHAVYVGQKKK